MIEGAVIEEPAIKLNVYNNAFGRFAVLPGDRIVEDEFARCGCWERAVVEFLRERCFPAGIGTYVDAGAHIGLTTVPVALRHPDVSCYAFEPEATNHWLLDFNVKQNKLKNVVVNQLALSDREGPSAMLRDEGRTTDHRIVRGGAAAAGVAGEENRAHFPVELHRLDSYLFGELAYLAVAVDMVKRPLVLKMDVQGHELAIMRGAAALKPDVIVFEYWPYAMAREGETLQSFLAAFAEYEYSTLLIESPARMVKGLLSPLAATIPWSGGITTNINLVVSRQELP